MREFVKLRQEQEAELEKSVGIAHGVVEDLPMPSIPYVRIASLRVFDVFIGLGSGNVARL